MSVFLTPQSPGRGGSYDPSQPKMQSLPPSRMQDCLPKPVTDCSVQTSRIPPNIDKLNWVPTADWQGTRENKVGLATAATSAQNAILPPSRMQDILPISQSQTV